MSSAVILAIFLFVVSRPILNAEERSIAISNHFERQRRQDNIGWSWTFVEAFGTTTYNVQDRQEINKPRDSISILPGGINISHQLLQGIFSKLLNISEVFINNASSESVNVLPEEVNLPVTDNLSPEPFNILPEIINASPEIINVTSETVHLSPKTVSDSQETNVSQRIQPVVETQSPSAQQVITNSSDVRMVLSEQQVTTETAETTTEENPCNRPDPVVPDFSAPGRRISEIKCFEYIWDIKRRTLINQKRLECKEYIRKTTGYYTQAGYFGVPAKDGEFPHMGAIGWISSQGNNWEFKCGGTLISPKFMLTAGHCTRAAKLDTTIADPVPKIVRLHDVRITNDGGVKEGEGYSDIIDVNISRIIPHPQYKSPMKYYDIALMELEREMKFDRFLQPACLWTKSDTSSLGIGATATGWGVTETSRVLSPILIAVKVKFVNYQQCDNLLASLRNRHFSGLQNHQLCAGNLEGGADACQGDSGGPLQVQIPLPKTTQRVMHYVVGVTSFGYGCGLANKPGVYTRVSSFVDWIEDIVWR